MQSITKNQKEKESQNRPSALVRKLSPLEYSELIVKTMPPTVVHQGDIYCFNGKFYEEVSSNEMGRYIYNFFSIRGAASHWGLSIEANIMAAIKYHPKVRVVESFDDSPDYINVSNGVIDLSTEYPHKLLEHSNDYDFSTIVEVEYDPDKHDTTNFMSFLNTSLTTDEMKPNKEVIESVLQMCGYIIYPKNKIEGIIIFLGDGENGKSLMIDILSSFFPEKYISSLSLKEISRESMEREQLITSRLNICSEEKGNPVDSSQMKKISSGQFITINRKNRQPLNIKSKTKIIVDSNTIPQFKDASHGTLRRLNIVKWENRAVSKEDYEASPNPKAERLILRKNRDHFFPDIMKEKSAILNLFLYHLNQLKNNDWKFQTSITSEKTMEEYIEQTDTLGSWLKLNYRLSNDREEHVIDILNEFNDYYLVNFPGNKMGFSTRLVGQRIKQIFRCEGTKANIVNHLGKRTTTTSFPLQKLDVNIDINQLNL